MNPARVKNRKAITSSTPRKLTPIEPEHLDLLVAGIEIERYRLLVQLAAWGGLRYGELVALRRRDIDLRGDYPVVSVTRIRDLHHRPAAARRASEDRRGGARRDAPLRTQTDHRRPPVTAHPTRSGRAAVLFGKNGGYLWESVFHKAWNKTRKAAGLPTLRIHDLRHSAAVWALQTEETFSRVQARLGHSTPAAALRYQHAASGSDERIAKGLDRKLGVQDQEPTPDQATPPAEPEAQSSSASWPAAPQAWCLSSGAGPRAVCGRVASRRSRTVSRSA
ncbi:MAG: tyrosine-type recombinase/integrase [Actinobacteria bacterium]|nr:tyrosine-type recombinase/integrase [Actinomycetota bacterium]